MHLVPLKIHAPAHMVENCVDWQVASAAIVSKGEGTGVCVLVLISPGLSEQMAGDQENLDKAEIAVQVLSMTKQAIGGFLGFSQSANGDEPEDR